MVRMAGLQEEMPFQVDAFLKVQRHQPLVLQDDRRIGQLRVHRPNGHGIVLVNLGIVDTLGQRLAEIGLEVDQAAIAVTHIGTVLEIGGRDDKNIPLVVGRINAPHGILPHYTYPMVIDRTRRIAHAGGQEGPYPDEHTG